MAAEVVTVRELEREELQVKIIDLNYKGSAINQEPFDSNRL